MKFDLAKSMKAHENKWVVLVDGKIVADGRSVVEVKRKAEKEGFKRFSFYLIPPASLRFVGIWA